jgi:hypothetical protein
LDPHRGGDRPPVRISLPQAFLRAGADATSGTLFALHARPALRVTAPLGFTPISPVKGPRSSHVEDGRRL